MAEGVLRLAVATHRYRNGRLRFAPTYNSHAVNGEFRVGEIAEARLARTLEILAAVRLGIEAAQSCNGTAGIDDDNRRSPPKQITSDRAGATDVIRNAAAITELHGGHRNDPTAFSQR